MNNGILIFDDNNPTISRLGESPSGESVYPAIRGEKGEKGDPGIDGATGARFEYLQTVPAAVWIVNHNLGFRPNVLAWSVGGVQMLAEPIHISLNQTNVYFDNPVAGFATCS